MKQKLRMFSKNSISKTHKRIKKTKILKALRDYKNRAKNIKIGKGISNVRSGTRKLT